MPEASSPPRAPTPLLKLRRQKAGKKQKLQHQRRTKRYKRLGFQQSVPGVREVRRAVEDVGEECAAHGVVPVLRYPSDLAARLWLEKPQADSVLGRVFRECELRQGGPRKTGRVELDGADPAQPNRHSRAGLPRGYVATPLLQRVRRGRQAPPSPSPHGLRVRRASTALLLARPRIFTAPAHRQLLSCAAFGGRGPALVVEQQLRPRREVWRESGAPYGGIRGGGKRRRAGGR
jgi:hypothetical protein